MKLSDFGLAKPQASDFTRTETEIRGTIVDPALDRFKDFEAVNDIYVVGFVLSYIFKGVGHLPRSSLRSARSSTSAPIRIRRGGIRRCCRSSKR